MTFRPPRSGRPRSGRIVPILLLVLVAAGVAFGVTALLVTIVERRQEARTPFVRVVEVDETTTDPTPWGLNWPHQYDTYLQSAGDEYFGGSNAMPDSKLEHHPWLKRLYAGYAFSIDYREARGHAFMLYDQEATERVWQRTQSGGCLHCHASVIPTYRRIGLEAMGKPADAEALGADFDWPAVLRGFELVGQKPYWEMHAELLKTPDGTPGSGKGPFPGGRGEDLRGPLTDDHVHAGLGEAHPVSCVDCHDPKSMRIRVTRPGFVAGIAALAASDAAVPHLPSVERWRTGNRGTPYDPNELASRQEMRSFVCAQCHVEYYCGDKMTLTFPWGRGLAVEEMELFWDEARMRDGSPFLDWKHAETGAPLYKVQHPEFELWSKGVHAQAGVSCADCHMPYQRIGAMKISSHSVRSPMKNVSASCQTCHHVPEAELVARVETIQSRTTLLMERAAKAMTDMLDAIKAAIAAGATPEELESSGIYALQRKAMWRLDFISSENSKGFHAPQESARILGESIDYSRQAEAAAIRLRTGAAASLSSR